MNTTKKIAVIGGGISGLSFAYRVLQLSKKNGLSFQPHVFEKSPTFGGTIQTEIRNDFILEKGPDGFLNQKPVVKDLAIELGIQNQLIGTKSENRRSMILQNEKLVEVPDGFYLMSPAKIIPFLRSPLLSWKGKIRTLLEPFISKKKDDQDESLASFVRRRFGNENLEKISQAMLGGIYTADPEHLSMQAALPRFVEMEKNHGSILRAIMATMASRKDTSGARYGLFGSFRDGLSTLVHALANKIPAELLHKDTTVTDITHDESKKQWIITTSKSKETFDAVVFCVPPYQVASIFSPLSKEQQKLFEEVPYASSAIFQFGFLANQIQNKPNAMGFIVPHHEKKHFIACSFMSDKYENRAPQNHTLLRIFAGGALQENILQQPQEQLRKKILEEITTILNIQGSPILEDYKIWPRSMPQYTLGHTDRSKKIQDAISSFPDVHTLGNAYKGVGIPDLIDHANNLAFKIITNATH